MYFEEAEVKEYYRKNKKGEKTPYYQIGVKNKSKFNAPMKIGLVAIDEIKKIAESNDINKLNELKANLNDSSEEIVELKQRLQESKATIESLTSEVESLTEEKIQLQEDLLKNKKTVEDKSEEIIEIQKEHKQELKEKTDKIETLLILINSKNNDIIKLAKRGLKDRFFNVLPENVKELVNSSEVESDINEE